MAQALLETLNQPVLVSLFTLLIGGYLFSRISERRAKQEAIEEKVIEFLDALAEVMNQAFSAMFWEIWEGRSEELPKLHYSRAVSELFTKRLSARVISRAYLSNNSLPPQFDRICFELRKITSALTSAGLEEVDVDAITSEATTQLTRLKEYWPVEGEELSYSQLDRPYRELACWSHAAWLRAEDLLTQGVDDAMTRKAILPYLRPRTGKET